MNDINTIRDVIRVAQSKLAKAERFARIVPENCKSSTEIFIQQGSEELWNAALIVLKANTDFLNICQDHANTEFFKNLKL